MPPQKPRARRVLFLVSFWGAGILSSGAWGATTIPSQAWSRDINAGGYTDGAPIGGFGAGTITWNFAGDFYLGRLNIATAAVTTGNQPYTTDANAHFYMYQKLSGQAAVEKMLNASTLGSGEATYYSLFPKAWVDYAGGVFPLDAKVTQFSPIIPGDYQRSSYPEGIYEWDVTNSQAVSCDVAVMLTFDNPFGGTNAAVTTSGNNVVLVLTRNTGNASSPSQGEFSLGSQNAAGVTVTYQSAAALSTLQTAFAAAGILGNTTGNNSLGAIAFKTTLGPGQSAKIPIVLAWDIPQAKPGTGAAWYREYTKYYGGTSTGRTGFNSGAIAMDALGNYGAWESSVDSWQSTILTGNYPDWLKQMLFNELYYYFTGGTMWEAGKVGDASFDTKPNMFSSLESYIYDFYGTSDVRFYGSWPLALLWPDIDKQEVKQFCDSVVTGTAMGGLGPLSAATCAHDIGDDNGVFTEWNAYVYRDSTTWKDLNSKLVLMVYRAWELTGKTDSSFLNYCWPAVQAAMTKVHGQCDASGLPISSGIDQTYDDLGLTGDTAYCGSLFLAACEAAQAMATQEGNSALAASYGNWLSTGQASFESLLWDNTGGYYHIDTGSSAPNRIMSDQLCGEWYAKALGLPGIVSDAHADSAWQKVHDDNWLKFDGGAHGVVNVMTSAGAIDTSYPQSQEAWVGVGWSVAAGLVQQGLFTQATDIGYSLYNSIWNTGQLWFRTPEAWQTGLTSVRAPYYMRANAIWALKHAYDIAPPPCGLLTCTATPTLSPTATQTPTATVNPCAFVYQTVDCGGPATVIAGVSWAADQAYTAGGFGYVTAGTAASTGSAIAGSGAQQPLYQTERYAATLEYKFNVPNGLYQVTLKNAEQYYTTTGNRVFSVAINGVTVITNMDLVAQVGAFTADDHTFAVSVTGGLIDIVGTASKDNAEFTAIEVVSEAPCSPTPTPTPTRTSTRTPTPSPTVSPTVSATPTPTLTPAFSPTPTLSPTVTSTATATGTPTLSPTRTLTATLTPSPSATLSPTPTLTLSPTATLSATATASATPSLSPTGTRTPTPSPSFTPSPTPSWTGTPTNSPTRTPTPLYSPTPTSSLTRTPSPTATASPTPSSTSTTTPTPSATPTPTLTSSPTPSPSATTTQTPLPTATATPTWTPGGTLPGSESGISAPFPNPSQGGPVAVQLSPSGAYQVQWDVFTTAFRRITGGRAASLPSGRLVWDLKDGEGRDAANGLYYWRVRLHDAAGDHTRILKVLVIR